MELVERLRDLAARFPEQLQHIRTEEATKNALVMPFINALGYNVFDPREVTPELVADVGTKKGEKVDYAILRAGKPIMIFECKPAGCNLEQCHASQLFRYFSVTETRLGVLTNGVQYRFFSDLDAPNKMDSKPFFEFDLAAIDEAVVSQLKKFSKADFSIETILATASELKYTREIKRVLAAEFQQPSEEVVRLLVGRIYEGRFTPALKAQFSELTKRAFQQLISDRVSDRLKSALAEETQSTGAVAAAAAPAVEVAETTEIEKDAFNIVRAIVSEIVDPRRVTMRDQQSYCAVLLDNNNRRPICRLWFNGQRKYVGLFDAAKVETKVLIADTSDIFKHSPQLRETVKRYKGAAKEPQDGDQPLAAIAEAELQKVDDSMAAE